MIARILARVLAGSALAALATWHFGWLALPIVGFLLGVARPLIGGGAMSAGFAAALAWAGFLLYASLSGDVGAIAAMIADRANTSATVVIASVLLFPALLTWSAALVGVGIVRRLGAAGSG